MCFIVVSNIGVDSAHASADISEVIFYVFSCVD